MRRETGAEESVGQGTGPEAEDLSPQSGLRGVWGRGQGLGEMPTPRLELRGLWGRGQGLRREPSPVRAEGGVELGTGPWQLCGGGAVVDGVLQARGSPWCL